MNRTFHIAITSALLLFSSPALADNQQQSNGKNYKDLSSELSRLNQALEKLTAIVEEQQSRIDLLEGENRDLKQISSKPNSAGALAAAGSSAQATQAVARTGTGGLSVFNPEIGVIADITAISTESKEDAEGNDKVSLRELELVIGHDIDPYSRLDTTITLSDFEDVSLEEAYVTYLGLPGGIRGRVGRLRPRIGASNALHRDSLETVDYPLVIQNYLGVEGMSRSGLELSSFIPLPWENVTHELIGGALEGGAGEEGTIFGTTTRIPSYYVRLKNSVDLFDASSLAIGTTWLTGSSDEDSAAEVNAFGFDTSFVHPFNSVNRLKIQAEALLQDRNAPFIDVENELEEAPDFRASPWGFYGLADYQLSERYSLGTRYDWLEAVNLDPDRARNSGSAVTGYFTFHQSEFARWRLQYQHVRFEQEGDDNRISLQGTFAIGVHKHNLQ